MSTSALGIVEIGKKQAYIFKSNRLREIIGASMIIRHISEELRHELPLEKHLSEWDESHVIIEGGGHAIYRFSTMEDGRKFNRLLSERVLREFPGVELYCCLVPFDEENQLLPDAIAQLFRKLGEKKSKAQKALRQVSWGIHRSCDSTQLPATAVYDKFSDDIRYVSAEILRKLNFHDDKDRVFKYFSDLFPSSWDRTDVIRNMSELKDAETGKVAVIHIDGNGMGKKFETFRNKYKRTPGESIPEYNKRYLKAYRAFSEGVDRKYKEAFRKMIETIEQWINSSDDKKLESYRDKAFPVRPVIFAGDDISFIAPGPLGVEAAHIMLQHLQASPLVIGEQDDDQPVELTMHACAGIAIVHAGYPFIRAHDLAEQLCQNAKAKLLSDFRNKRTTEEDASLLDFHILYGDWSGSLSEHRSRNYEITSNDTDYHLTMKPFYVFTEYRTVRSDRWNNMGTFAEALERVSKGVPRSKIKKLRDILKQGPFESSRFIKVNRMAKQLGTFHDVALAYGQMFTEVERICPYYDAIEAMDDVILLTKEGVTP